jgi:HK97 family phage major capsid protein
MGRDMLGVVANIDCTGKVPLLRYDNGARLLVDRPIRFAQDFPGIAASAKNKPFMAFGDLKSYLVGIKGVPDISFSEHARHEYNQTQARLVLYFDIKRKHTQGMTAVKTANA